MGLWNLTGGELGTNGTIDIRLLEAQAGAEVWGASRRENLEWPDGDIDGSYRVNSAVEFVRRCRPATVLVPHWDERHPDHVASSHLLTNALFKSALRKYDAAGDIWRPDWACHDFINKPGLPCL